MSKDLLVNILRKEIGIGAGLACDIADACTAEQLSAVTDYIRSVKRGPTKHYIDNWEKYTIMMMTAFKAAEISKFESNGVTLKKERKTPVKALGTVSQASMEQIRQFLGR